MSIKHSGLFAHRWVTGPRYAPAAQLTGVAGTGLIALSSVSTGAIYIGAHPTSVPIVGRLVDFPVAALAGALVGMGLLAIAWLMLAALAVPDGGARSGVRKLYRTLALWAAPLLVVPPMFSDDVYIYVAYGATADRGLDPYALGPVDALGPDHELARNVSGYWQHSPAPYGPVFITIAQLINRVTGGEVIASLAMHRVIELLGIALIALALPRLVRRAGGSAATAVWLGLLNPLVLLHLVAGMHNEALMIGLALAGTELALGAVAADRLGYLRLAGGVGLITMAASVKLPAAVALAVVGTMLARRWGGRLPHLAAAGGAMLVAFAGLTVALAFATGRGLGWLGGLNTPGEVNSWLAPTNQLGFLAGGIGAVFGADITQTAITIGKLLGAVVALIAGSVVVVRLLRGRLEPVTGLGLFFAIAIVCGPVVQPWYLLWCVIPLAACALAEPKLRLLAVLSAALSVIVPPLGAEVHGDPAGIGLAYGWALAVLAVGLAAIRRMGPPAGRSRPPNHRRSREI
ncbi:MAG: hypothetical protein GEU86_03305 [Actinophytocola sp.]|nr:hypothetical protein [Actinophytocola sp.]